jgi:hypothetical protein
MDKRKFNDLQERAKAYPFKATTPVTTKIDPRSVENLLGDVDFIRLPDLKGNNVWHFMRKSQRDWFIRRYMMVNIK